MTQAWPPKAPGDVFNYTLDITEGLSDPVLTCVATADGSSGIVIDSQSFESASATVVLSAGTTNRIGVIGSFAIGLTSGYSFTRDMPILIAESVEQLAPTTATKRAICALMFEEIGLAGYIFDATTEEYNSVMRRLDMLMNDWRQPGTGIDVGYNFPLVLGSGQLDDVSGIPDEAINAVVLGLAVRYAPVLGKTLSAETRQAAASAFSALRTTYSVIPERVLPRRTLRGAGAKPWGTWSPFIGDVIQ